MLLKEIAMFDAGTGHDNQCPGCGQTLRARQNGWNWSTKRFCSEECRERYLTTSTRGLCPECDRSLYAKGETRSNGRPKRFCSETCKTSFNTRREQRALVLYDLMMGRRHDKDHPLHGKLDTTITRLRAKWDREDRPKNRPARRTWYDWHRHVPEDLSAPSRDT